MKRGSGLFLHTVGLLTANDGQSPLDCCFGALLQSVVLDLLGHGCGNYCVLGRCRVGGDIGDTANNGLTKLIQMILGATFG